MKGSQKNFGRVDIQVTGILCGFHTLWFVFAGICVGNEGDSRHMIGKLVVLWACMCGLSAVVSALTFKRISNPGKKELWSTDLMTQLKNRNAFEVDMHNMETKMSGRMVAIIVIDLDHLKKINDAKGHAMGDVYIYAAAKCIREEVKKDGVAYRIGGDEFAVILYNAETLQIENLILRIQERFIGEYSEDLGEELFLSAGYAIYKPESGMKLVEVLTQADENMYKEKKIRREKSIQKVPS